MHEKNKLLASTNSHSTTGRYQWWMQGKYSTHKQPKANISRKPSSI